jgi:16S rRNA (adenine1518-N6/adenine1519-N6)-dimethyltransferase
MVKHIAKKRFGQNFLVDEQIIQKIIEAIRPELADNMVEIGPGLGALTAPLLKRVNHLDVIEVDYDIVAKLKRDYPQDDPDSKLTVHAADALDFNFAELPCPLRVVGNLPYNISTPLLFHVSRYSDRIKDMHFMLQNEVVERMIANPSTPEYGRLSAMLQYRFQVEKLMDVQPEAFRPVPKVNSAIVRMIYLPDSKRLVSNEALYAAIVKAAFGQRRKTLRNALKGYLNERDFEGLAINPSLRAENLSVPEFIEIANYCDAKGDCGLTVATKCSPDM